MRTSVALFLLALAAALWSPAMLLAQSGYEFGSPAGPLGDFSPAAETSGPAELSGAGTADGTDDPTLRSLEAEPAPSESAVDALASDDPLADGLADDRQASDEGELTDSALPPQADDRQLPDDGEPMAPGEPTADDRLEDDRRQGDGDLADDFDSVGPTGASTAGPEPSRRPARREGTTRYRVVPRLLPLEGLPGSLYRWSVLDAVPVTGSPDLVEVVDLLSGNVSWADVTRGGNPAAGAQAQFDPFGASAASSDLSSAQAHMDPFGGSATRGDVSAAQEQLDPFDGSSASSDTSAAQEQLDPFDGSATRGDLSAAQEQLDPFGGSPPSADPSAAQTVFDPFHSSDPASPAAPGSSSLSEAVIVAGDPVLLYTRARGKVRGKLKLPGPTPFDSAGAPMLNTYLGTLHPVIPRGLRLPVDSLEKLGEGDEEPPDRRFESAEVPIFFARAEGSDAAPSFNELSPDDPSLATLHVIDYEGGLAEQMAHYAAAKPGLPLKVFVNDDGGVAGAYESRYLPVPGRKDLEYRSVDLQLMGGGVVTLVEPCPIIVFSTAFVENQLPQEVLSTFKHELGHVLHELRTPTRHRGYGNTFWQHSYAVRSNDQAAFVEGFAEYSAFRFSDGQHDSGTPQSLQDLQWRHNVRAYEDLTFFYWLDFRNRPSVKSRLSSADLDALQLAVFDYQGRPDRVRPSPEEFQARIVREATGKGQPPFTAAELNSELASHNASNPNGLKNWASERVSPETQRQLNEANADLLRAMHPILGQSNATVEENLAIISKLSMRSPEDLMMNEGTVAALLLELDRELAQQGVDFYGKVLENLDRDPYATASGSTAASTGPSEFTTGFVPPQRPVPTNFKELIALLDRDPELTGKLFPVIEKASRGVLTAKHFVLAPRRSLDPLTWTDPGDEMASASGDASGGAWGTGGASGEPSGPGDPIPDGREELPGGPVPDDELVGSDDRMIPEDAPETQPDFDDLRGR